MFFYQSMLVCLTDDEYFYDRERRTGEMIEYMKKNRFESAIFMGSGLLYFKSKIRRHARKGINSVQTAIGATSKPILIRSAPSLRTVRDYYGLEEHPRLVTGYGPDYTKFGMMDEDDLAKRTKEVETLLMTQDIPTLYQNGLIKLSEVKMAKTLNVECGFEKKRNERVVERDLRGDFFWKLRNLKFVDGEAITDPDAPEVLIVITGRPGEYGVKKKHYAISSRPNTGKSLLVKHLKENYNAAQVNFRNAEGINPYTQILIDDEGTNDLPIHMMKQITSGNCDANVNRKSFGADFKFREDCQLLICSNEHFFHAMGKFNVKLGRKILSRADMTAFETRFYIYDFTMNDLSEDEKRVLYMDPKDWERIDAHMYCSMKLRKIFASGGGTPCQVFCDLIDTEIKVISNYLGVRPMRFVEKNKIDTILIGDVSVKDVLRIYSLPPASRNKFFNIGFMDAIKNHKRLFEEWFEKYKEFGLAGLEEGDFLAGQMLNMFAERMYTMASADAARSQKFADLCCLFEEGKSLN